MAIVITYPPVNFSYPSGQEVIIRGTDGPCATFRVVEISRAAAGTSRPKTWGAKMNQSADIWSITLDPRPERGHYQITVWDLSGDNATQAFDVE
jgi:hypothetical protein